MTTIQELLMHPNSGAVISDGRIKMHYNQDGEWIVINNPIARWSSIIVLYSGRNEAGAVRAFAKATGLRRLDDSTTRLSEPTSERAYV